MQWTTLGTVIARNRHPSKHDLYGIACALGCRLADAMSPSQEIARGLALARFEAQYPLRAFEGFVRIFGTPSLLFERAPTRLGHPVWAG